MKRQLSNIFLIAGMGMVLTWPTTSRAETPILTFVDADGRTVITNAMEPASAPAVPEPVQATAASSAPRTAPVDSIPSLIHTISTAHGVDPALVSAVMKVESNNNRLARSPKGALGLMQLIPATGRRFGVRDFYDPQQNIEGGVRYLRSLLEMFDGNVDLSLAAYNAGENLVKRLGRIPAIPETRNYVRKIRAIYKKSSSPVLMAREQEFTPEKVSEGAPPDTNVIFRTVNERGVVRFSNIAPPN